MGWNDLTTIDAKINGLTSLIIVGVGIVLFLHLFSRYLKIKRPDILITALALISLSCSWLGGALSFISVLLTGHPISPLQQTMAYAWTPPVSATLWVYLGFRLAIPQFQKHALGVFSIISGIHLFFAYVLVPRATPEVTSEGTSLGGLVIYTVDGNMSYTSFRSILLVTILIFVLSASLLVGILFLRLSRTTDRPETRIRGLSIGIGAFLLGAAVIFDEIVTSGSLKIISRVTIATSMVLLYLGYLLPPWFRRLTKLD